MDTIYDLVYICWPYMDTIYDLLYIWRPYMDTIYDLTYIWQSYMDVIYDYDIHMTIIYGRHIWLWHTYDNHIWTSYMIRTKMGKSTTKTVHIWGSYMIWLVHIWFDIQIIYRFQTIYDLTYDLKSLLVYDPIYD